MLNLASMAKPLMSDFKFGFELEGFILVRNIDEAERDELHRAGRYQSTDRFMRSKVRNYMNGFWPKSAMPHGDGSLNSGKLSKKGRVVSFEWPSPVLDMTPNNITKCIDALSGLRRIGVYTNKSCGLHVHMSFPTLDEEKAVWLMCQLALDVEQQERIFAMRKKGWFRFGKYDFTNSNYAPKEFLATLAKEIRNESYYNVRDMMNNTKYRVLRIHPQGTLEWRGPRGFLDDCRRDEIRQFFMLLWGFADWMRNKLASTEINGISREHFMKRVRLDGIDLFSMKPTQRRWHKDMSPEQIKNVYNLAPWLKKAKFRDAYIDAYEYQNGAVDIHWCKGEWLDGVWEFGTWYGGTWQKGVWKQGRWHSGVIHTPQGPSYSDVSPVNFEEMAA